MHSYKTLENCEDNIFLKIKYKLIICGMKNYNLNPRKSSNLDRDFLKQVKKIFFLKFQDIISNFSSFSKL
jgi:hypothetical protein